jgi:hypothetical protein
VPDFPQFDHRPNSSTERPKNTVLVNVSAHAFRWKRHRPRGKIGESA